MKPSSFRLEIVLDTKPILDVLEPISPQLARIQLTPQSIGEYVFSTWHTFDSPYLFEYNEGSPLNVLINNACSDMLNATVVQQLPPEERATVYHLLVSSLTHFYMLGRHALDNLGLHDHQLATMRANRWVGKALIVDILT